MTGATTNATANTTTHAVTSALPPGYRAVGENRIREIVGVGLADFVVGQVIEHRPARTVTETDHVMMLALSRNPAPVHSDTQFCERTGRDRPLVCGMVTLGIVLGATVRTTSGLTTASLALNDLRLTHPVHVGDTLHAESEIIETRPSTSRPDQGVVTCRVTGYNEHDQPVITFTRTFLVPIDATAVRDATGY